MASRPTFLQFLLDKNHQRGPFGCDLLCLMSVFLGFLFLCVDSGAVLLTCTGMHNCPQSFIIFSFSYIDKTLIIREHRGG